MKINIKNKEAIRAELGKFQPTCLGYTSTIQDAAADAEAQLDFLGIPDPLRIGCAVDIFPPPVPGNSRPPHIRDVSVKIERAPKGAWNVVWVGEIVCRDEPDGYYLNRLTLTDGAKASLPTVNAAEPVRVLKAARFSDVLILMTDKGAVIMEGFGVKKHYSCMEQIGYESPCSNENFAFSCTTNKGKEFDIHIVDGKFLAKVKSWVSINGVHATRYAHYVQA
ncbi:MAG: hypothetical protein HGB34_00205 [Candidatus Moranbacteria bacterium]|nr:hypothetical protein [Candidatus Moranbacteria bacterium]